MAKCRELSDQGLLPDIFRKQMWVLSERKVCYFLNLPLDKSHFITGVRDGYIRPNPATGIMLEIKKSYDWEKPKRHALTIAEQETFIGVMEQSKEYRHWLLLFTTFLGTGCHVGELVGLRWKKNETFTNLEGKIKIR